MIALALVALALAAVILFQNRVIKGIKQEHKESKERFKITYDLLWMEVRDKNDLTYDNMAQLIVSMQKTDLMPAVRETLAKRITGESNTRKQIGFK